MVESEELEEAMQRCEAAIKDACFDMHIPEAEADTIAYDIIMSQCLDMRPELVAEVRRVMLGILPEDELNLDPHGFGWDD